MIKLHPDLSAAINLHCSHGFIVRQIDPDNGYIYMTQDMPGHEAVYYLWLDARGAVVESAVEAGY